MKKKVLVKSPVLTLSGYGEHARTVVNALRKYDDVFDIYLFPLAWGQTSWLHEDTEERKWIDATIQKTHAFMQDKKNKFDIFVHVTIPNEFERLAPRCIGITAGIETDRIAPEWVEKCNMMDLIIVPSEHSKKGIANTTFSATNNITGEVVHNYGVIKPVRVIGYPAKEPKQGIENKFEFECDFNFLAMSQVSPRKNSENLVKWFVEEFYDQRVGLILKYFFKNNSYMDRLETEKRIKSILEEYKDRKCVVQLIHGYLSEDEVSALYQHPSIKAYINIAHGEGFGLPEFQAVCNAVPVVTVDYAGHRDFLYAPVKDKHTSMVEDKALFADVKFELDPIQKECVWEGVLPEEGRWAYAHQGNYKIKLRDVYKNYIRYKSWAEKLQKHVLEKFNENAIYRSFAEIILGEKIVAVDKETLPKVSIITSVFDAAEYLEGLFKDVTRQTMFNRCEWVIVHPKTSPTFDKEKEIISSNLSKHTNIKYVEIEKDDGLYDCWNIALEHTTGEYITNWNTDDARAPNAIEKQAKMLYTNPDSSMVYMDSLITSKPNETYEKNSSDGRRYNFPEYSLEVLKNINLNHANAMWKKSLHDKYGKFESKYKSAGDWDWALRIAAGGEKLIKLPDCLGLYYFNPKGISTNPENNKWKREEEREVFNKYKDAVLK